MSVGVKSMRAAALAALASRLRWVSTTPFGVPSEPDVKRMTAGSSGGAGRAGAAGQDAGDLVAEADVARTSSR